MSLRWLRRRRRDPYYCLAKRESYRSRAAYKLKQLQERFFVIRPGDLVIDLGASPGGWSQVAAQLVGPRGRVVAVDRAPFRPIERVAFVRGDLRDPATREKALRVMRGELADCVLSDMSPDISGNYSIDHARSIELCEAALDFARDCLRPGGVFVTKVFQGGLFGDFLKRARASFRACRAHRPAASRSSSSEIYVVCRGFRGPGPAPAAGRAEERRRGEGAGRERPEGEGMVGLEGWTRTEEAEE
ncbi:MAG: RlmE family RNA methyltransferase [Thermoplasmatota archaeon]